MSGDNEWNEKLCGCTNDCASCCYGFWCTPCLFGSNAETITGKNCFLMCCLYMVLGNCYLCWLPHMYERQKLREKYNLREDPCNDLPTTLCCSPCALCQEAREIKAREDPQSVAFKVNSGAPVISQQPGNYSSPVNTKH